VTWFSIDGPKIAAIHNGTGPRRDYFPRLVGGFWPSTFFLRSGAWMGAPQVKKATTPPGKPALFRPTVSILLARSPNSFPLNKIPAAPPSSTATQRERSDNYFFFSVAYLGAKRSPHAARRTLAFPPPSNARVPRPS